MPTKRTILVSLVIAALALALPSLSYAQIWLQNYSGTMATWISNWTSGLEAATKLQPAYTQFKVDSIRATIYHPYASSVTGYVKLYEDNGSIVATWCGTTCIGPGATPVWTSAALNIPVNTGVEYGWSVPGIVMNGAFVVAVELTGTTSGKASPLYTSETVPCCEGYIGSPPWNEHHDNINGVGREMIRVHGTNQGTPNPAALSISAHSIFYGNAMIPWQGGPEAIKDTLIFTNVGGGTDTVSALTMTNADFYWTGTALPWYLGSGQSRGINVTFQTTTPGWRYGSMVVTHTGANATIDTVDLSGIGFNGHWLENFYQIFDPLCGPWYYQRDSTLDVQDWGWYLGGYSDQDYQMGHQYTLVDSFVIDWQLTSQMKNPGNAGVQVRWMNENRYNADYYFHGFYWTCFDSSYYYFVDEILPTAESGFVEEGPHFVNTNSDSISIVFLYMGSFADSWFLDDIRVDSLPHLPPVITHEHHSDDGPATWINPDCIHITARVYDPNNDPMTVTLLYRDHAVVPWSSVAMTPVAGCEIVDLYEVTICDLDVCHTYDYYFQADDNDAGTPTTFLPVNAPTGYFQVDILDNTKPQISYDNGTAWYVRYNPTYWEERFAVRFTPASYPYTLGGAMVRIGAAVQGFPDDDHEDVVVELYNDDGAGGKPGTMIGTPYMNNGTSWNEGADACDDTTFSTWVYVKIEPCVTITDGDFYIAVRNRDGSVATDKEAFAYDQGPAVSPYRSWIFYADIGQWGLDTLGDASDPPGSSTNLMIRSIQCGCIPSAPTNLTVIYNAGTGNAELRWTDLGQNQSYKIYRSLTDPFSGFGLALATVAPGVQFYADPIGANTKAFYRIQGSCDPPSFAPPASPTETGSVAIGPVRRTPSNLPTTLMVGQQLTLEEQIKSGMVPKKINKAELEKFARTTKIGGVSHSSWNLK